MFVRKVLAEFDPEEAAKVCDEGAEFLVEVVAGVAQEDVVSEAWDVSHRKNLIIGVPMG